MSGTPTSSPLQAELTLLRHKYKLQLFRFYDDNTGRKLYQGVNSFEEVYFWVCRWSIIVWRGIGVC